MKCIYCHGNAQKIRKDTYTCTNCGEFSTKDVLDEAQDHGKKSRGKQKFTGRRQ